MVHRGIATLAAVLMLTFLFLGGVDSQFALLHLYQSLIYLAIILMLFYFEDRYAYMLGMLSPAVWLLLAYAIGLLGGAKRQFALLLRGHRATNEVSLLAGLISLFCVLMILFCAQRWRRQYAGLGKGLRTFLTSCVVVVVYYGILIIWFWRLIPRLPPAT